MNVYVTIINVVNVTPNQKINVGDMVKYTVNITNHGLTDATGVTVTDKWDTTLLKFVNACCTKGDYDNNTNIWNIGELSANETATLQIFAIVTKSGIIINNASLTVNETNLNNRTNNFAVFRAYGD